MRTFAAARRAPIRSCSRELAGELKANKLAALEAGEPDVIATANIGCMIHLAERRDSPVRHWVELLESRLRERPRS